jgi:uncharacterized protein YutE (UPF0331/DUF86 family)
MSGADKLPADRANRIADAVEDIVNNVSRLRELQSLSRAEYKEPEQQDRRDSVERKFVKMTAAMLDIAEEVIKQEDRDVPRNRKATVKALEDVRVISPELAITLRDAVEFRDVLAHTYGPIVNDDIVYDALQRNLDRFEAFVDAVDAYLST